MSTTPATDTHTIDINDQPGHLIRRAHQIAVSVFHETMGREVTPVQYAVMRTLETSPGIDQVRLAQQAGLDTSTAADIAARLESKGWITRQVLARGQRELRLSAAGEELLAGMVPTMAQMQHILLDGLDAKEQAQFLALLRKFVTVNNERSRAPLRQGTPSV
jgi:DNA-binding MarR family transcriptional regulator